MRKIIAVWLAIIMLVGGVIGFVNTSTNAEADEGNVEMTSISTSQSKSYPSHDPIYIDSNDDFVIGQNGVVSGTGIQADPYIIENWDIDASSTNGIKIKNTDVYFVIRNCVIHDGSVAYFDNHGIYFYKVTAGKIENCEIYNNDRGIYLRSSSGNYMTSNQIYNNSQYSIVLSSSSNNYITSNYIYNNSRYGIYLGSSPSNNITSNQIYSNNDTGVYLYYSSGNILRNNVFENNTHNFGVWSVYTFDFYQYIDTSNTINEKPIYYIIEQNDLIFDDIAVGFLGLISCSNIVVKNLTLIHNLQGLLLVDTSHSTITSNYIYNNSYGIHLDSSSHNNMTLNQIYNNTDDAIYFHSSSNNYITSNHIYNNSQYGIYLKCSSHNNMTLNQIYNNFWHGIYLKDSSSNNLTLNHIYNKLHGIYFSYSSGNHIASNQIYNNLDGICLYYSSNNNITANLICNNSDGIFLYYSSNNNRVTYCNISDNTNYGIYVRYYVNPSNYNVFYHNNFINNTNQSYDECTNFWDNGYPSGGNYWSDYRGCDLDGDGIGDDPYYIIGGDNKDNYPLMVPWNITVNQPPIVNITYPKEGQTVNGTVTISGTAFDPDSGEILPCAPIYINGNANFTSENGVVSGSGTESDPYLIEGWDIDARSAHGIYIRNADVYFIIRDCIIHDGGENYNGIYFFNVTNGKIDNVTSYNHSYGIYLYSSSSGNTITNCTVYNNFLGGIDIHYSANNNITNCNVYKNYCGIFLFFSSINQIINCALYNNNYGILPDYYSQNNTITNCIVYNHSYYGIWLYESSRNRITNCAVYNNNNGVYQCFSSNNEIHYCNIYNNTDYGVCNYNSKVEYQADATYNWWGSADGPYHPDTNPDGTGDNVTDNVLYDPWLTEPVEIAKNRYRMKDYKNTPIEKDRNLNGATVQFIEVKIDDGDWQLASGTTSWSFIWDTTTVSNGWHTIYARAFDGADYSEIDSIGVYVDNLISELTPHEPISINDNDDFTLENGVVSGSGTESDPYIIEGYDINAGIASYPTYAGVHIENTDAYFIIRNCVIHDGYEEEVMYNYGIYFYNVTNGKIENATSYKNSFGIYLYDSPNNNITDCAIYNNSWYGIYLDCSPNNTITDCISHNNSDYGIRLYESANSTVTNCTIFNNSCGIGLSRSLNCKVENCTVYNHTWGGISVSSQSSNNRIANCAVYNNSYCGIQISSSVWNTVVNCSVYNNSRYGVYFSYSQYNQIVNSTLYNNTYYNIYLSSSLYDQVTNCVLYNSNYGGYFYACLYDKIAECTFYNNRYYGIYFASSLYNQITNNSIINCSSGIYFYFSFYNQITNCALNNNSNSGIYLSFSSNNTVIGCNVSANNGGIYLYSHSNNNYIYHNNFINNTNNAYDECANYWDYNGEGNYWSDYNGTDENGDGIGDSLYNISGGSNKDNYPLIHEFAQWDKEPPTVTIIEQSQTITTTSFTLHWSTNATDIQYFEISTDGIKWVNVGTNTSYTFTNLIEGNNILYVRGTDLANNTGASSSLTITVEISEEITYGKEEVNWLLYGGIIVVILVVLMLAGIGITRVRVVKRRKILRLQIVKCVYCQEITKITSRDKPLLFECPKCGGKSVIR